MRIEFPQEATREESKQALKEQSTNQPIRLSLIAKLREQRRSLLALGLVMACVAAFMVRSALKERRGLSDFAKAYQIIDKIHKSGAVDLSEVEGVVANHPELRPKLDSFLIREYLRKGDLTKAGKVHAQAMKRLSFLGPLFTSYSKNSLVMEKKDFAEALAKAEELQALLSKEPALYPRLYFFNLLRLSFLSKTGAQKSSALSEIENCLQGDNSPLDSSLKNEIAANLTRGKYSLLDFLKD